MGIRPFHFSWMEALDGLAIMDPLQLSTHEAAELLHLLTSNEDSALQAAFEGLPDLLRLPLRYSAVGREEGVVLGSDLD